MYQVLCQGLHMDYLIESSQQPYEVRAVVIPTS